MTDLKEPVPFEVGVVLESDIAWNSVEERLVAILLSQVGHETSLRPDEEIMRLWRQETVSLWQWLLDRGLGEWRQGPDPKTKRGIYSLPLPNSQKTILFHVDQGRVRLTIEHEG